MFVGQSLSCLKFLSTIIRLAPANNSARERQDHGTASPASLGFCGSAINLDLIPLSWDPTGCALAVRPDSATISTLKRKHLNNPSAHALVSAAFTAQLTEERSTVPNPKNAENHRHPAKGGVPLAQAAAKLQEKEIVVQCRKADQQLIQKAMESASSQIKDQLGPVSFKLDTENFLPPAPEKNGSEADSW